MEGKQKVRRREHAIRWLEDKGIVATLSIRERKQLKLDPITFAVGVMKKELINSELERIGYGAYIEFEGQCCVGWDGRSNYCACGGIGVSWAVSGSWPYITVKVAAQQGGCS